MSQELGTTIYSALCACFGLSPSSSQASALIREMYQEPENSPRPPRSADVIYFSSAPDPSPQRRRRRVFRFLHGDHPAEGPGPGL